MSEESERFQRVWITEIAGAQVRFTKRIKLRIRYLIDGLWIKHVGESRLVMRPTSLFMFLFNLLCTFKL